MKRFLSAFIAALVVAFLSGCIHDEYILMVPSDFPGKDNYKKYWDYVDRQTVPVPFTTSEETVRLLRTRVLRGMADPEIVKVKQYIDQRMTETESSSELGRVLTMKANGYHLCVIDSIVPPKFPNAMTFAVRHELEHCYVRTRKKGDNIRYYWDDGRPLIEFRDHSKIDVGSKDFQLFAKIYTKYIDETYADLAAALSVFGETGDPRIFDDLATWRTKRLCEDRDYAHWSSLYIKHAKEMALKGILSSQYKGDHRSMAFDIVTSQPQVVLTPKEYYEMIVSLIDKGIRQCYRGAKL